jgi:hypothetical protein
MPLLHRWYSRGISTIPLRHSVLPNDQTVMYVDVTGGKHVTGMGVLDGLVVFLRQHSSPKLMIIAVTNYYP